MKISCVNFDGLDVPMPTELKFTTHDGENTLRMNESERTSAARNGQRRHQQHIDCATAERPSHNAITLTDRIQARSFALMSRNPDLTFSEATQRVINAHPELWADYCKAQAE
jgi:hypothetical protein